MTDSKTARPAGLSARAKEAYAIIMRVAGKYAGTEGVYTGGCRAFYSPAEWKERGERYCTEASLIVVYDGGDFANFFGSSEHHDALAEDMEAELREAGFSEEAGTHWFSGIYDQRDVAEQIEPAE